MNSKNIDAALLAQMFKQGTAVLNQNKSTVDALNVFPVPDGDTGTNMSLTMSAAVESLDKNDFQTVEQVAKAVSKGSLMGARGNSGVILSQIFRGFSKGCKDKTVLNVSDVCHAFKESADTAYSAVLKPVEGTILTVIRKIAEKAIEISSDDLTIQELFEILIHRGEGTLARTPEDLDVLKQAGVVDAGGQGLLYFLMGCLDAIKGIKFEGPVEEKKTPQKSPQALINSEDITFGYCTEFILETEENLQANDLKVYIEKLGDSMVFVQDEELVKVHIHTNTPGLALEEALKYGALKTIKIENMREQHHEIIGSSSETEVQVVETLDHEPDFGFIAVSMGAGFVEILKDLGISGHIQGGQTMNPSTEDFLKEIEKCHSEHIFLFPNNSNIIMAANQAKEISDKKVYVIPTKTMPQCISAMIHFNRDLSAEENYNQMIEALSMVKTIQITYAVRDTSFNDKKIETGDYLAVSDGDIKGVGKDQIQTILNSIRETITEDDEMISLYYGEDVSEEQAHELAEQIEAIFPELEVEIYEGSQPVYYYVISIE